MMIIHRETTDDRLHGIAQLIQSLQDEISNLEVEANKLRNGDISLRSLGLPRTVLYPLWREGLRTVGDVRRHGSLNSIRGLGPVKVSTIIRALEDERGKTIDTN